MTGQSLTLLVGVPLAAWLGSYIGWRGVNLCVGVLAAAAAISLLLTSSRQAGNGRAPGVAAPSLRSVLSGPVLRLLSMGIAERVCYGLTAVYYATFLQFTYDLPLHAVAAPLAVFATGNILGTVVGGQLADRLGNRLRIFAVSMVASGVAALALFGWCPDVTTSVALGFAYVFLNGIARPSLLASLADTPPHIRGTVMGLNSTSASVGWIGAAGLGGWMMGSYGFSAFGPLAAGMSILAAVLALGRENRR
jgi:DHA1 family inner membrane transport protein